MSEQAFPNIGDRIFVWPRMRTVRHENREPVTDGDGAVMKKPAHVRSAKGALITGREFVTVDLHILGLIRNRNLDWSTAEKHREHIREKTAKHAAAQKEAAEKAAVEKAEAERVAAAKKSAGKKLRDKDTKPAETSGSQSVAQ